MNGRKENYTKCIIYKFWEKRSREKPRNRWQDEVMEHWRLLVEKGGMGDYKTDRNGRNFWEQQGTVAICTCQWMSLEICGAFLIMFPNCEMQLLDSSCPSLPLSVPTHEQLILECLWIFRKSHLNINISLQSDNNSQCFTPDRFTFAVSTGWMFVIMRECWDTFWEEIKTHFSFKNNFQNVKHCSFLKTQFHSTVLEYVIVLKVNNPITGRTGHEGSGGWGCQI